MENERIISAGTNRERKVTDVTMYPPTSAGEATISHNPVRFGIAIFPIAHGQSFQEALTEANQYTGDDSIIMGTIREISAPQPYPFPTTAPPIGELVVSQAIQGFTWMVGQMTGKNLTRLFSKQGKNE